MRHDLTMTTTHRPTSGNGPLTDRVETTMRSHSPVSGNMFRSSLLGLLMALLFIAASPAPTSASLPVIRMDDECKLEGNLIGVEGATVEVNGTTVTFSNWVQKDGEPNEYVGFDIDKSNLMFTVKAGNQVFSGSGDSWSNPNGTGGNMVMAISNIDFCMNEGDLSQAFCYIEADNDGRPGSQDGISKLTATFSEVALGLSGTDHIEGLTFVPSTNTLYASDADAFGSINTTTGAFTLIGYFGSGNGAQGSIDFDDVDGLAWDPFEQIMYASVRRDNGPDDLLIQVDVATGQHVPGAFGGDDYVVVEKINGLDDIDDIAISTDNGQMYAIQNEDGQDSRLILIDKATGATTDFGDLDVPNVEGLGFYPDGRLLGVNGDSFRSVMQIPLAPFTGDTIPVADLGINDWLDYEGIACLTEPDNRIEGRVLVDPELIDLELEKSAEVTPGEAADEIEYTITVTNDNTGSIAGPNAAGGVAAAGVTVALYRDKGTPGVYDPADEFVADVVTAIDGTYAFTVTANGNFIVRVDLSTVTNNAYEPTDNEEAVSFGGFGETSSDNDFNFFTFTDATNVSVKDYFPAGAVFASASESQGTFDDGSMTWDVGTLAPGATATLTLFATTTQDGTLENCAEIMTADQDDIDSTPGNGTENGEDDQDCVPTEHDRPDPEIDLKLEKSADVDGASLGDTIVYTLTVTNESANDGTDIFVTDSLPYGVTFVSSTPAAAYDSGAHTVTWNVGDLDAGQSKDLDIEVIFDGFGGNMPSSMFLADGEYVLRNHPDGNAAPPYYGLRLDDLYGGFSTITFDFEHAQSDMRMTLSDGGASAVISGTTWGGVDNGGSFDHAGLWNVSFTFSDVLSNITGDDDLTAQGGDAEQSSGTITPLYDTAWFNAGEAYQLADKEAGGYSFRLGNRSNDLGHRGHDGISGWGWLLHDGDGTLDHKPTSDFLFTAYPVPDMLENCAEVTAAGQTDVDSTPNNAPPFDEEDDDACVRVPRLEEDPEIDIEVEKTASTLSPEFGEEFTYTITVSNNGPDTATNLVVTEHLPAGVSYVSHVESAGSWDDGTGLWTIASLAAGHSETLVITVSVDGVSGSLSDGEYLLHNHPGNDFAPPGYGLRLDELFGGLKGITFDFDHADSEVIMTVDGNDVTIDGVVYGGHDVGGDYDPATEGLWNLHFEYDNVVSSVPGDDDLYVKDANAGASTGTISPQYSTAWFTAGDVFDMLDKSDGSYSFRLGDEDNDNGYNGYDGISGWGWIMHGQNGNLVHAPISDWVFTAAPIVSSIENCVELTAVTETDVDSTPNDGEGDDYDCITITPGDPAVDLGLEKDVDVSEASVNDIIHYTLTVSNDSDAATTATNVLVEDVLPDELQFIDTNPSSNVNYDAGTRTLTWLIPAIAPGESFELDIEVRIIENGFICNCAEIIDADQLDVDDIFGDGTGEDYDCAATTTDEPFIDLHIDKSAFPTNPGMGDIVDYTITVRNDGSATQTAFGIQVVDNVPAGMSIQSTDPMSNVAVNNATNVVSWLIPSLAPGDEVSLHIYAQVNEPGQWENCAEIMAAQGNQPNSVFGNGTGQDIDCVTTTTPDPTIDLSLVKSVDNATPAVGDDITFTLTVTNDGSAIEAATGVVVEDQLPGGVSIDPGFFHPDVNVTPGGLITWNVGTVGIGDVEILDIPVTVNVNAIQQNCAEITAADQDDVDSTPDNGVGAGEDDASCVTITPNLNPPNLMCYVVADNEDHNGSADVLTYIKGNGQEVSIGLTGSNNINAIEYVGANSKLYAVDGNTFGTINTGNGLFSPIGTLGSGQGVLGGQNFDDISGLALDPYTGVLYASVRKSGDDLLIQINMLNGQAVTNAFGPSKTYVVIPAVSGSDEVDDIAIHPDTGVMYGVVNGGGVSRLITIDKATGASALAANIDVASVRGLAFRANGQLLGTLGSTTNQVRRININTGATTLVSNLGIDGNFDYEAITCNTNVPNELSGTVYLDNNEDALLDAGDVGQSDVTVQLWRDKNSNGVLDGPDYLVGTRVTDMDGTYEFLVLNDGYYIVQTDLGTYPAGAVLTTDNIETAYFPGYGDSDTGNDFGFKLEPVVLGSIGDEVFSDDNANGVRDPGEAGLTGILIRLYDGACPAAGTPLATRVSNASGGYDFSMLPAGTYCVDVDNATVPSGYALTTANDPMTVALGNGEDFNLADFGFYYDPQAVEADLELTKEVDTSSPALDGVVEFTITVTNHGPADATGLIVRDIIPVGLVFQDYDSSRGTYEANKLGYWTIGDLAVGQTETLRIRTKVVITNMIENIAQVSHVDQEDPDSTPGNGVPTEDDQDNALVESRGPGSVGDIIAVECADLGTVNALQYSTFDGQIYSGTEVGTVHISNDDGQNWPSFLNTDNGAPVRDIVLDGNGWVYAGSFGSGVYRSQDSGDNWMNVGPANGAINDLDVDHNTNTVYAAADGKVMRLNGLVWQTVGAGTNPFAGDQVLAVVYHETNNTVLATSAASGTWVFDGGTWASAEAGLPTGKVNVLFRSPDGIVLAGHNNRGVFMWGGASWMQLGLGLDNEPIESIGSGPNGEVLAGSRETGAYFLNKITGEWLSIGNLPVFTVSAMTGGPTGEVYAGAPGEGIYVIYDQDFDGIPDIAHQVANFMTSAVIQDLVVAPNGDMWAATYGYGILYSNDGGNCWTRMNRGLDNLWTFAIDRTSDGTLFIGIWADGLGGIWRSRDDGRNWEFLAYGTRQIISLAVDPVNEDIIYAGANIAGEGALFRSMDGGDSWSEVGNFIYPVWSVTVDPNDNDHVFVGTMGAGIYESFDQGLTFDQIGSPTNGLDNPYVFDMVYAPVGTPYAGQLFAATDAGVYRYDAFAQTWILFGQHSEDFQFRTIAFTGTEIYGGTWNAGVVQYNAFTNEWVDYGLSDMPVVAFAVHQQSETLVIGTSGSGVFLAPNLKMSTSVEDEVIGSEVPTAFALDQNYPNPFNPQTSIPFDLRETTRVKMSVFDMLGREVGLLVDGTLQAGQHQVTWDAGDVPSGTYLVRMEAAGQTFTRTMILLK